MNSRKFATNASALSVGAIAAYVSYRHQYHLAVTHGQSVSIAACTPLTVDAAIIVATLALRDGRKHVWSAWALFWTGVLVSIAGNFFATSGDMSNHVISVIPALMFVGVVEVIARGSQGRTEQPTQAMQGTAPSVTTPTVSGAARPVPTVDNLPSTAHKEPLAVDANADTSAFHDIGKAPVSVPDAMPATQAETHADIDMDTRHARARGEATQAIDAVLAEHVDWDKTHKAQIAELVGCHPKTVDRYFSKAESNGHKKVTT